MRPRAEGGKPHFKRISLAKVRCFWTKRADAQKDAHGGDRPSMLALPKGWFAARIGICFSWFPIRTLDATSAGRPGLPTPM
jgi:hypothetical protein